ALVIAGVAAVYYMPQPQPPPQTGTKGAAKKGGGTVTTDPVPVLAIVSKTADVPVYLDGVGTARALNTVTVRPQVDGKLINISFIEGQECTKGYVLAKIVTDTYTAAHDVTVVNRAMARRR